MTRSISFLLFLWMTWMAADDVVATDKHGSCKEKSCSKDEICAKPTPLSMGSNHCVKAKHCAGSEGGQCPAGQFCQWHPGNPKTYVCVKKSCSEYGCPPGQVCIKAVFMQITTYRCERVCTGQSDSNCPLHQVCNVNPNKPDSYACQFIPCIQDTCAEEDKVCRNDHCVDKHLCGGQTNGPCPPGQKCTKEEFFSPYSCVGDILCKGKYEGQCGKGQVCTFDGPPADKFWSCKSKEDPCPPIDRKKCPHGKVCRIEATSGAPSCQKVFCSLKNVTCLRGEYCHTQDNVSNCVKAHGP